MDRARAELAASRARIAAVMATEPWPGPADRNPGRLQDVARERVKSAMDARAATAAAALERAEQLRGRIGLVARALAMIGVQTPSVQAAAEATRQAEWDAKTARLDYRENLGQADRSGAAEADQRQRERDQWESRADVRAARREDTENRMVAAAARDGDHEIQEVLAQEDGLRIAREIIARREAEMQRHQQLHNQRAAAATALRPGPAV